MTADDARHRRNVTTVRDLRWQAPAGTIALATYDGLGGLMPTSQQACHVEPSYPLYRVHGENHSPGMMPDAPASTPTDTDNELAKRMADNVSDSGFRGAFHGAAPPLRATVDHPNAGHVVEALGAGVCPPDAAFDHFLSEPIRSLSAQHFTPLAVAARAAQWFDECNIRTVVDIGSGAGKFCVAAALSGYCHFTGLEHRERLVACARRLARRFGVESRTHFIHGALGDVRLPIADAYYLFNPFEENVIDATERIDESVELSSERWTRDLQATHALLSRAAAGTYALIYNGFGGALPTSYRRVRLDRELPNPLCLWRKAPSRLICRWQPPNPIGCADAA